MIAQRGAFLSTLGKIILAGVVLASPLVLFPQTSTSPDPLAIAPSNPLPDNPWWKGITAY